MGRSFTLMMIMFLALLTGCASKLLVVTEPSGAEVYLRTLGGEEKLAGKTPLELSDVEIRDLLRLGSTQAQFIQVRLSLVAFEEMNLFVPSSKWGQRRSLIKLTMTPVKESTKKRSTKSSSVFIVRRNWLKQGSMNSPTSRSTEFSR